MQIIAPISEDFKLCWESIYVMLARKVRARKVRTELSGKKSIFLPVVGFEMCSCLIIPRTILKPTTDRNIPLFFPDFFRTGLTFRTRNVSCNTSNNLLISPPTWISMKHAKIVLRAVIEILNLKGHEISVFCYKMN